MKRTESTGGMNSYWQIAPSQYLNEEGIVSACAEHVAQFGTRALVSGGPRALKAVEKELFRSLTEGGIQWECHTFRGYSTAHAAEQIASKANDFGAQFVIGLGGGRSLDAAKAAAELDGLPVVTIPTIAATCAAASAVSIIYDEQGRYVRDYYLAKCPSLVLCDPAVIANAPPEYLVSGILDALSKYYEGRTAIRKFAHPDVFTVSAISLATSLADMISREGMDAIGLVRSKRSDTPLRHIIDLNIHVTAMIQGLGKLSTRGAAAHAVHDGLTILEASHAILHGMKVGYGIVVQLFLENASEDEIRRVVSFFRQLGLDPTLAGLGLPSDSASLRSVAERAADDTIMSKMPFEVTASMVERAMVEVETTLERVMGGVRSETKSR